jgi:hypothetical protein
VARLDPQIRSLADEFVLVRLTRMRGVDLALFDFDYDLTWMAFFLDGQERVLGRYGGRDAIGPDSRLSLPSLKYAMERAVKRYRDKETKPNVEKRSPRRTVEEYSAAKRLTARACVHCHQVYDLRRESLIAEGKWQLDELWVYPLPENVGLTLELNQGDMIRAVGKGSSAERAGLRKGDKLLTVNALSIASFADLQYALHRAKTDEKLAVAWERDRKRYDGTLDLEPGWRKTDLSWRWSLRGVEPSPWVQGADLSAREKEAVKLTANSLAFRQGPFVTHPARMAGIRQGDVIVGVNGKRLDMTGAQFGVYIRLNYKVGDTVTYNLLRDGKPVDVSITLRAR